MNWESAIKLFSCNVLLIILQRRKGCSCVAYGIKMVLAISGPQILKKEYVKGCVALE